MCVGGVKANPEVSQMNAIGILEPVCAYDRREINNVRQKMINFGYSFLQ